MSKERASLILVLVLSLAGTAWSQVAGHWKFDDGSGTKAADSSGNGYDGSLLGDPQWVTGYLGGALEFDGTGDYVDLSISSLLGTLTNSTFALWVDFSNQGGAWQRIFDFGINETFNMFLTPRTDTAGPMRFAITITSYNDEDQTTAPTTLPSGWHHVAVTLDADNHTHSLYLDGEVVARNTSARYTPSDIGVTIQNWLGRSQYAADAYFDGSMDDFRIYSRVLTQGHMVNLINGIDPDFAQAYAPVPKDGGVHTDTWVNLSWSAGDFAVSHDVYLGVDYDEVNNATHDSESFRGNQVTTFIVAGFPGFPYPEGLVPGTTYYWRIDEVNEADPNSPWKGQVWSFSVPPKKAYNPNPPDSAESVELNVRLTWTAGFGAKFHTLYFGDDFDVVSNATSGTPVGSTSYNPGLLREARTYYWRVDEFDAVQTHKGDVWSFTTIGAVGSPYPPNGAVDVEVNPILSWNAGTKAASHEVYLGADADTVKNATTASPEYKGTRALGEESYDPGTLLFDTAYYWRIDEVNATHPESPWKGNVWNFTTGSNFVVDDFEFYNDIDPPDPASNRIFDSWIDGFGTTDNGALVGNELPPYAEQTIVHSGAQSMPYFYDNNQKTSEATLTLVRKRDWTIGGVTKLSLWFRGDSGNAAERMFIALNGTAVVYHDDPAVTQIGQWTRWIMELQAFTDQGVNLANVNTLTIGFGTKNSPAAGGSGTMHFDDIRLYR